MDKLDYFKYDSIWKILFVLGADEYLERLEGKTKKCIKVWSIQKACGPIWREIYGKSKYKKASKNEWTLLSIRILEWHRL